MWSKIMTGNVGLVYVPFNWRKPATYISVPTRLILNSIYSHAVIFLKENRVLYVVEALPFRKVTKTEYHEWASQYPRRVKVLPMVCPAENITGEIGKRYDLAAALWSHLWFRLTGKWNGRTGKNADRKRYCFELVAKAHNLPRYWQAHPNDFIQTKK
jgi:hypothetical protein